MKPKKPATGTRLSLELRTQLETLADTTEGRGTEVLRLPAGLVSRAMAGEELSAAGHERVIAALDRVRAEQAPGGIEMNARNEIVIDGKQVAIVTYERTPVAGDWVRWTAITFHPMTGEVYRVALGGKMSTVFVRSAIEDKSEG